MNDNANATSSMLRPASSQQEHQQEKQLLQAILTRLSITSWDLLIVGDGSGSGWASSCGWASVLVDRNNLVGRAMHGRRFFYGAMNQGSVNLAESMPYLHALQWYDANFGKNLLRTRGTLNVHILTDSQTIAHWGTRAMQPGTEVPRKGLAVWAAMREFRRVGYHCHMHWAARMTTDMNWVADAIAGLSRTQMKEALDITIDPSIAIRAAQALDQVVFCDPDTGEPVNPYLINPDGAAAHANPPSENRPT